jgi:hypothetical protein
VPIRHDIIEPTVPPQSRSPANPLINNFIIGEFLQTAQRCAFITTLSINPNPGEMDLKYNRHSGSVQDGPSIDP